jgi:prepilin-type N-terminal cleavage/methylation domain-containing protein
MIDKTKSAGFTLIEIVIVIALTSIVMVMIFQALGRVRTNEARFDAQREGEKDLYFLYNRLDNLFKNTSSFQVFNNREHSVYFLGTGHEVIFLSRAPLISTYRGLYFIQLRFEKGVILYREKMFQAAETGDFISFAELENEPFYPLLENVVHARFQYYLPDSGVGDYGWREVVNSFEKDPLPLRVSLDLSVGGNRYDFLFYMVIHDENQDIPDQLLQ